MYALIAKRVLILRKSKLRRLSDFRWLDQFHENRSVQKLKGNYFNCGVSLCFRNWGFQRALFPHLDDTYTWGESLRCVH
jgi:hypothetical protein